jgi:hypothetical protein
MSAPDDGLERPWRQMEDACRPILESRQAREATWAHLQNQDYESLILDTVKSASAPGTASEAFALLRYIAQTPDTTSDDNRITTDTKAMVVAVLEEVIATAEGRSVSDMHARINFIEQAAANEAAHSMIAACARSLRRDVYAFCRGSLGEAGERTT